MNILAIETSCDDTAIAVVKVSGKKKPKFEILSNVISSQVEIHKEWGGVHPTFARREHEKNLPLVLKRAMKNIKIDAIAVTVGPGLDPCLWTGINFAKDLAKKLKVKIIPVNHIEAHILVNFNNNIKFPAMALIVSGGHTQLILVKGIGKYKLLGETRDDAAGECLDKVARILGLEYPGGPIISAKAKEVKSSSIELPRPMINTRDYDFSFSGLKTAVLYNFKKQSLKKRKSEKYIREMCKETQQAVIDVLIKKTTRAVREYGAKTIILGGGVTANIELRKQFKKKFPPKANLLPRRTSLGLEPRTGVSVIFPPKRLSTDNAVMIAIAGYFNKPKSRIKADANLRIC